MPNQQLIDYIKQQLERGVPANSIKEVLSKVGWNELDITQAFSNLNRMPVQAKKIMPQTINPIREEEGEERIVTERKPVYSNEIVYKPMGVEFISVLYFIISLIAFIFSGLSFFGIKYLTTISGINMSDYATLAGTISLSIGIIGIFMSIELWKMKNWARIIAILISLIGSTLIILYIYKGSMDITNSLISNVVSLIVSLSIVIYLSFSRTVKRAFK